MAPKTVHYMRQFLAPEESRYDRAHCYSYIYLGGDPDDIDLEAEFTISDGYQSNVGFDGTRHDNYDEHLAVITALMEQIIAYRQAYAEALAKLRGQGVTR